MERPLTVQEAAEMLEYHPDHLRRLLRAGRAKGERIGQVWLIDRQEVARIKALQGPGGRLPKEPKQNDT
jgi:excisionase family DNA binding protein